MTDDEQRQLRKAAEERGIPLSELLRIAALRETRTPVVSSSDSTQSGLSGSRASLISPGQQGYGLIINDVGNAVRQGNTVTINCAQPDA